MELVVIAYSDPAQTNEIGRAEVDATKGFLQELPAIPKGGSLEVRTTSASKWPYESWLGDAGDIPLDRREDFVRELLDCWPKIELAVRAET